ncbi:FAD-binding domain-containing protein [Hypoxylon sp. FL1284]|nr:FAD-binding domain-containing protein [Hypoxylon sp. FL1284]
MIYKRLKYAAPGGYRPSVAQARTITISNAPELKLISSRAFQFAFKMYRKLAVVLSPLLLTGVLGQDAPSCRCTPGDSCWPSQSEWDQLNTDVGGKLIATRPIAEACYPASGSGSGAQDPADCDYVAQQWPAEDFQTSDPIGRVLPYNVTCPPINYAAGESPPATGCSLGINPVYAVNATTRADVNATVQFARRHNVRAVISGTGHDLLGRSDGYGGLEVWLRYYRNSIDFQPTFTSSTGCSASNWTGSAIRIDGVYQWRDVSAVARSAGVIVATGGSVSVGAVGGWPTGGGHGPATSHLGFGADQILEADMLLADGRVVTADACGDAADLYRALRGGGPGYGVILSMTVKTYPDVDVATAHHLTLVPAATASNVTSANSTATDGDDDTSVLLDAIAVILQRYPALVDAGVGGYAYWYDRYPYAVVGSSRSGYTHGVWTIGQNETIARAALDPVVRELRERFSGNGTGNGTSSPSLTIRDDYVTYAGYWAFYDAEMGLNDPEGNTTLMTSRIVEREQVVGRDPGTVRGLVGNLSTADRGQYHSVCALLVAGDRVARDGADPFTGMNPAWRRASYGLVGIRVVPLNTTVAQRSAIDEDMLAKGAALSDFAPGTGAYLNEADRNDPNYIENFYGDFYDDHLATKNKYDPDNIFYCATCVGSEGYVERPDGPLCRA